MNYSLQNRRKENIAAFLQYTILFCILVLGIFSVFILEHRTFFQDGDGVKQGFFWLMEDKHHLNMLLEGKGLQLWSWSKLIGMSVQTNRYWDPFNWIAAAFPLRHIQLGYTLAIIMRFYCGGLSFLGLMRYDGREIFSSVIGAVLYTFAGFNIVSALAHPDFLINIYLFPLIVLSVEMVYKGKNPVFFSLIVGLYLVSNIYQAYMAAISIIIFILLRFFAYRESNPKGYAKTIGEFLLYGILGICVGGIQFFPDYASLSGASTDSVQNEIGILFEKTYYLNTGLRLIDIANVDVADRLGWTLIVIMLVAVAISKIKLSKTPTVMTVLLLAGLMFPAVCSLYNCLGYPARRWIFAINLFASWAAVSVLDESESFKRRDIVSAATALVVIAFMAIARVYILGLDKTTNTVIMLRLIGGLAFMGLLLLIKKRNKLDRFAKSTLVVITVLTLSIPWTVIFKACNTEFYKNNEINKMLSLSSQRAGALIDDEDFYRVDQMDYFKLKNRAKNPANETLWWQTRSIYGYNTRLPGELLEFNCLLGNNYGYSKRVSVLSNDNRTGLDYLYGVKYFLGDDLTNDKTEADEYAGYGFKEYKIIDGVNVLRNKYNVSLGYLFDKYMSRSEFEKLNYAEREQALLQAVVLPDGMEINELSKVGVNDLQTSAKELSFTIKDCVNATVDDECIIVNNEENLITLELEDLEDSQLLLSISGLEKIAGSKYASAFKLYVKSKNIEGVADYSITNQAIPNVRDYTFNLGYYENYKKGNVTIRFSSPGNYSYEDIKLYAMSADLFDSCIDALDPGTLKIDSFSDHLIEGSVDSKNGGILFLSIIEPEVWECFVDGEEADIIKNTDIAFSGVVIPDGHHSVTLRFRNRMVEKGIALSIFGLIMIAFAQLIRRRKRLKTP